MIKVKLMGGLGNQMFQFAFGYSMAKNNNTSFFIDQSELLNFSDLNSKGVKRVFDLEIFKLQNASLFYKGVISEKTNFLFRNLNKLIPISCRKYFVERFFSYDKSLKKINFKKITFEGYWQSYKYFEEFDAEIRSVFINENGIIPESKMLFKEILGKNSACVNVRRGDFVSNSYHGVQDIEYYKNAFEILVSKQNIDTFYIFSDDIEWCENNFEFIENKIFVHHTHKGYKFGNYFELMRNCKHFIIPNSSFAWWAAWLGNNSDKVVICPLNWFSNPQINTGDLIPKNWVRI
jgi:hypothetical protein